MKLQDQCCTFEQAKKLKELGVKQYSVFLWQKSFKNYEIKTSISGKPKLWTIYPAAFTCAELGEICPYEMMTYYSEHLGCWNWQLIILSDDLLFEVSDSGGEYKTEAEARADCLITSIEKGYITVEEVNKRLQE